MSSATMASSSVSQEDVENDFEKSSRRSRIRMARGRDVRGYQPAAATACRLGKCSLWVVGVICVVHEECGRCDLVMFEVCVVVMLL